jgi:hypothetical protein
VGPPTRAELRRRSQPRAEGRWLPGGARRGPQGRLLRGDPAAHKAIVDPFGTDYEGAVAAYEAAEREHRNDENIEVVLLGSDSRETLERTHSSCFELLDKHVDQVIARELAALGLR